MKTIDILQNLKPYWEFLEGLKKEEIPNFQHENGFERLETSISSQYSFITLELNRVFKNQEGESDQKLLCKIVFEIIQGKILLKDVYHDKPRRDNLFLVVSNNKKISDIQWQTEISDKSFYNEYLKYLSAADEIASVSVNCASGDNYRPGFYSEIKIGEEGIELNQINRMNSKSLDHKNNYSMRDLKIFIPFNKAPEQSFFDEYIIGKMKISFSDRSSPNLKSCGDAILAKIKEVKEKWQE